LTTDLSEFTAHNGTQGSTCGVGIALTSLLPTDAGKLEAALAADKRVVQHAAISRWLAEHGYRVGKGSVSEHRNGSCSCRKRGIVR
jgi:hypothetical protein